MPASPEQREHSLERTAKVFEIVKRAAELGEPCPTNKLMAERLGCSSVRISDSISFLHSAGMIEVQRMNARRIVTICASGLSTAGNPGKPHWSAQQNMARAA